MSEQALPEKVLEAEFLLILWLVVRPSSRNYLGTWHSVGSVISTEAHTAEGAQHLLL